MILVNKWAQDKVGVSSRRDYVYVYHRALYLVLVLVPALPTRFDVKCEQNLIIV